ncbi:MAG: cytochrome c biogenesis protein CcsA [Rhodocyclaceae bacterium]
MTPILLHLVPAALYGFLAVHFWRSRYRKAGQDPIPGLQTWERVVLLAALGVQGVSLFADLFPDGGMRFGFSYALATIMWLALVFYWIESLYTRLDGLQMLGLPLAALCAVLPLLAPGQHSLAHVDSPVFRAHFLMAMLAYSLFTLAALHALLMAVAEKQLHRGRLTRAMINLPPLLTMEALLFRLILMAFVLLTLTLASGVLFSENLFGKALSFDHKTVFAIASWLIFAALLAGRHFYGWRGRKALRWTLAGFVILMLAYVGTRFVLEAILHRA